MNNFRRYYYILMAVLILSCNEWDDHSAIRDAALNTSLIEMIKSDSELSKFTEYLEATGYDETLASSKMFTVWAPTNDALANLDVSITSNPDKLKQFVANHISFQQYQTKNGAPDLRVKMLSGKHAIWDGSLIEDVTLVSFDKVVRNGILHKIANPLIPKLNIWEQLAASTTTASQRDYLESLNYELFVDSLAVQIGVDPNTGEPIYEEGTGLVERNTFLDHIASVNDEDELYTFIILTDAAFDNEVTKLLPYFKTATMDQDSMENLASWYLVRDLAIEGKIIPDELPDTIVSQFGVKIPIDKSAIVETHLVSNGIVYVMSSVDFKLEHKLLPILIEGEKPSAFSRSDKNGNIFYRYRTWASNGFDLSIRNHSVALFNVRYRVNNVYSTTYQVYWRAVHDWSASSHQQRLVVGDPTATTFPYITVTPDNYEPVYIGDYTVNKFGYIDLYMVSANSTNNDNNPLVLDYIKLVPVL